MHCTHWCEGSEAHAFLATALLNVLREELREQEPRAGSYAS